MISFHQLFTNTQKHMKQLVSWSYLSVFGNSYLAKLAALSPIVAIFVKLQKNYLSTTFGFTQVEWLYWSLIFIAIGQGFYIFFADRTIKKYGRDKQKFIMEASATWTTKDFDEAKSAQLKWYVGGDKSRFAVDSNLRQASTPALLQKTMRELDWSFPASNFHQTVAGGMDILSKLTGQKQPLSAGHSKTLAISLNIIFEHHPELIKPLSADPKRAIEDEAELKRLCVAYQDSANGPEDVKRLVLSWHYDQANEAKFSIRTFVAMMYGLGSMYFIWRSLHAFFFMLGVPGVNVDI